jgi:hypothetical protein
MKLDYLKEKKELVGTILLAVSVLSAVLIVVKVTGFFVISANAENAVKQAIEQGKPDAKNVTTQLGTSRKVADSLKKQNLFSPPPPRQNPVQAVLGIFGDEALINGKWYKAGARVADARVVAVGPTSVTVEWDGKEKVFRPIDAAASPGPTGSSRSGKSTVVSRGPSAGGGRPAMVVTGSSAGTTKSHKEQNPLATKMKEMYEKMSHEQKQTFKKVMESRSEQFKQMSDTEKAHFKAHAIERISHTGKGR